MNILPKLEAIEARHQKLATELSQPEATNDMEKFTSLNKEYAELTRRTRRVDTVAEPAE